MAASHQGRAQKAGLRERPLEEALRGIARDVEAERPEVGALPIDESGGTELLGEPPQLAARSRALIEIHEVDGDPPLGEEPLRLAGVLAVPEAEDLNGYCRGVYCSGVREAGGLGGWAGRDAWRLRNSCQTLIGIGGVPGACALPIEGP